MCGILITNDPYVTEDQFCDALCLMHHRGPDADGVARQNDFLLGHRRLKVLDLHPRSNQPFTSADGRFVMIYNGEVYNHRELAAEYRLDTRTTGDTEVLLELITRHGEQILSKLNGMFALVVLDTVTGKLFVCRDRLGIKPLYIRQVGNVITIASEVAPILKLHGRPPLDEVGIRQFRKLRTFFDGRTLYTQIRMFPAGHYMKDGRIHRYWELPSGTQPPPEDDELEDLIASAIKRRCIADVEVGNYLSGGLDSTIVAGLSRPEHTWTVGFPSHNEFLWARPAAERYGTRHHEIEIGHSEFIRLALKMIETRQEPLSVPNEVLLYKMTRSVKMYNTVILSGEGADELFFGYDRIFRWAAGARHWDLKAFADLYCYGSNDDLEIVEDAVAAFMDRKEPLAIVAAFFQISHLHGLLRRLDNATMMCSVEARVPFVDHTLVERMSGVPFEYRMCQDVVKAPIKRLFRDLVPRDVIQRKKMGFPVPLDELVFPNQRNDGTSMDRWLEFNLAAIEGTTSNPQTAA